MSLCEVVCISRPVTMTSLCVVLMQTMQIFPRRSSIITAPSGPTPSHTHWVGSHQLLLCLCLFPSPSLSPSLSVSSLEVFCIEDPLPPLVLEQQWVFLQSFWCYILRRFNILNVCVITHYSLHLHFIVVIIIIIVVIIFTFFPAGKGNVFSTNITISSAFLMVAPSSAGSNSNVCIIETLFPCFKGMHCRCWQLNPSFKMCTVRPLIYFILTRKKLHDCEHVCVSII